MILSFREFNELYESANGSYGEEYSNGIEIMESLLTVIQEREVVSESEIVTFLDNVLEETGWELNDEVYESYGEWLADWSQFIDEGINEDESEMLFTLTRRGQALLEGIGQIAKDVVHKVSGYGNKLNKSGNQKAFDASKAVGGMSTKAGRDAYKAGVENKSILDKSKSGLGKAIAKNPKLAMGAAAVGAAGLGYGAYKGIKALKARSAAKKAAAQGQQGQQGQ